MRSTILTGFYRITNPTGGLNCAALYIRHPRSYIKKIERHCLVTAMNIKMLPADLFIVKSAAQTPPDSTQSSSGGENNSTAQPQNTGASWTSQWTPTPPEPFVAAPPAPPEPPVYQAPEPVWSQPAAAQRPLSWLASALTSPTRLDTSTVSAAPSRPAATQGTGTQVRVPQAQYYLCTVIDHSYVPKMLTQYRSLEKTASDFQLVVCCTDEATYHALTALRLPRCTPVSLDNIGRSELYSLQRERKANEFCWTLKSYIMMFLLQECGLPHVLYCDADIAFTGNLALIYEDWGSSAVYLCTQRDVDWVERKYGKYQAGIVGARNNDTGIRMLDWWRGKCREWCFNYEDSGRLGDQKYLDEVPALFGDVKVSWNKGIDAAPWNIVYNNNYNISAQNGRITIDGDPLVAYHYACVTIYDEQHFDLWNLGNITIQPVIRNNIYVPYIKMLREAMFSVKALMSNSSFTDHTRFEDAKTPFIYSDNNMRLLDWNTEYAFCTISSRTYVARTLALYSSIRRFLSNFHLWICCADDTAYSILSRFSLENTTLLRVSDVETPEILSTRPSKTITEYCWTLKPALCSHVLTNYNVNRLLYCDSDIYFFSHPRPIYDLWTNYATLLNRQLGTPALENKHGMYQAGMIGFSKSSESIEILNWWLRRCTEWCYDDHSNPDRWGDQKYLQKIPNLFTSIRVNDRYGFVAAPWNIVMNNTKGLQVSRAGSDVYLGSEKLVAYHFGSINMLSANTFDLWKHEPLNIDSRIIELIYTPYLTHLSAISAAVAAKGFSTSMLYSDTQQVHNPFTLSTTKEADHARLMFADR